MENKGDFETELELDNQMGCEDSFSNSNSASIEVRRENFKRELEFLKEKIDKVVSSGENLYISFDFETNGRSPIKSEALQFGISIQTLDREEIYSHCWNLYPRENKTGDKSYVDFWKSRMDQYVEMSKNRIKLDIMIKELKDLISLIPEKNQVWIAYPVSFDWVWLSHLYYEFAKGETNLKHKALCLYTMFNNYAERMKLTEDEKDKLKYTLMNVDELEHNALEDARAHLNMYFELRRREGI